MDSLRAKGVVGAAIRRRNRRRYRRCRGFSGAFVLEERMTGPEFSLLAMCDGTRAVALPLAQDHKRIGEGDQGPNTGGMGGLCARPGTRRACRIARNVRAASRRCLCCCRGRRMWASFTPASCLPPTARDSLSTTPGSATLRRKPYYHLSKPISPSWRLAAALGDVTNVPLVIRTGSLGHRSRCRCRISDDTRVRCPRHRPS